MPCRTLPEPKLPEPKKTNICKIITILQCVNDALGIVMGKETIWNQGCYEIYVRKLHLWGLFRVHQDERLGTMALTLYMLNFAERT